MSERRAPDANHDGFLHAMCTFHAVISSKCVLRPDYGLQYSLAMSVRLLEILFTDKIRTTKERPYSL